MLEKCIFLSLFFKTSNSLKNHSPCLYINIGLKAKKILNALNRKYRLDLFIKDLNLVVEFDEDTHEKAKNYLETDEIRQREIESEMGVVFIRVKEKTHMGESLSSVIKKVLQLKYGILGD